MTLPVAAPPVDRILLAILERDKTIPAVKTGLFLPTDLKANMPFVTVTPLGGSTSATDLSGAFDVDIYTATRGGATGGRAVCDMVEAILTQQPLKATVDGRVRVLDTLAGALFQEVPWDDETVRHYTATFQVGARRV